MSGGESSQAMTKTFDVDAPDRERNEKKKKNKGKKKPITSPLQDGRSKNPKAIRARARRRERLAAEDRALLMADRKPIEEWDDEELARGRQRDKNGTFLGRKPKWIDAETHEEIIRRLQGRIREGVQVASVQAIQTITDLLTNDEVDDKGKPKVPAGVKLQASTFLVEHVIGKPQQRTEVDINVRLQRVLANAMVTGSGQTSLELAEAVEDAEVVEDDDEYYEGSQDS